MARRVARRDALSRSSGHNSLKTSRIAGYLRQKSFDTGIAGTTARKRGKDFLNRAKGPVKQWFGRQSTLLEVQVTLDELLAQIEAALRRDPLTLRREDIPSAPGVYVWYSKATRSPVYIGKAAGGNGLRHRIWAQHLNPRYLEGRVQKMTAADAFQLSCAIVVQGQPRIDKSVFRRNIGRRERIAPGQATVDYIHECFEVAWVVLPQSEVAILERELIARFAAKWDLYNLSGNPST